MNKPKLTSAEMAQYIIRRDGKVYVGYNDGPGNGERVVISYFTLRALDRKGLVKLVDRRPASMIYATSVDLFELAEYRNMGESKAITGA